MRTLTAHMATVAGVIWYWVLVTWMATRHSNRCRDPAATASTAITASCHHGGNNVRRLHTCRVRSAQVGCEGGEGEGGGQTGGGAEGGAEREVEAVADHCKEHHGRRSGGGGKVVRTILDT